METQKHKRPRKRLPAVLADYVGAVKICTEDGSGYIYCGPWPMIAPEEVDKQIDDYWDNLADVKLRAIISHTASAYQAEKGAAWLAQLAALDWRTAPKGRRPKYDAQDVEDYLARLTRAHKNLVAAEHGRKNHKPLMRRWVIETYPSIECDALIVKVTGEESGEAWTMDEYNRPKRKGA